MGIQIIQLTDSLRTYVYNSLKQASEATKLSEDEINDALTCLVKTSLGYFVKPGCIIMLSENNDILGVYKNLTIASCWTNVKPFKIKYSYNNDKLVYGVYFALIDKLAMI